jgi:hypothetical protein
VIGGTFNEIIRIRDLEFNHIYIFKMAFITDYCIVYVLG